MQTYNCIVDYNFLVRVHLRTTVVISHNVCVQSITFTFPMMHSASADYTTKLYDLYLSTRERLIQCECHIRDKIENRRRV